MNGSRIFFVCPDINKPTGGIKQIYRQVDILNNANYNAFILHENNGYKCTWFNNTTRVVYYKPLFKSISLLNDTSKKNRSLKGNFFLFLKRLRSIKFKSFSSKNDFTIIKDDIFVFPEIYGPNLEKLLKGNRKVIYNQGVYQTFFHYNLDLNNKNTPYLNDEFIACIVNSENALKYLNHVFPNLIVRRVHYGIDHNKFYYSENKKKQIAFMPRRLRVDLVQVINILKFRNVLDGWRLVEIDNMDESQVANAFRDSAFFLSFSINEGFGMPPAEAMACGCIVVGYPGKGGQEFFKEAFSYPIDDRDVMSFAKTLEKVIVDYNVNNQPFIEKGKMASKFILSEYELEVEKNDIIKVWDDILNKNNNA